MAARTSWDAPSRDAPSLMACVSMTFVPRGPIRRQGDVRRADQLDMPSDAQRPALVRTLQVSRRPLRRLRHRAPFPSTSCRSASKERSVTQPAYHRR
jgi:hypothetical protein